MSTSSPHHIERRPRRRWLVAIGAAAVLSGTGAVGLTNASNDSATSPSTLVVIEPCRLADTRAEGIGPRGTPLGSDEVQTHSVFETTGRCTPLPQSATAIVANVTVVSPTAPTFMTIYPADRDLPLASFVNTAPGSPPIANAVTVALSPMWSAGGSDDQPEPGAFNLFNKFGSVDYIVDLNGYYISPVQPAGQNWAVVGSDGAYLIGAFTDLSTERIGSGVYEVPWLDASECAVVATPATSMLSVGVDSSTDGMTVYIRDLSGAPADSRFSLMWSC